MPQIAGYNGQLDWGAIVDSDMAYRTNAWSLDVVADALDATDFTSAGWREFIAGLKGWTGSIELFVDSTKRIQPSDVGATAALKLYLSDGQYLNGSGICIGWHPAVSVDGIETQTLDFQGTSDLFIT